MIRWLVLAVLAVLATPARAQDQANVVASCGSVTLTAGQQSFRTIDLNGVTCNSGGGTTGVCSQATNYLVRTTGGNAGGNASAITSLICGLVNDGVWSRLDALYVFAQQNSHDAHLNLVSSSHNLPASTETFNKYKGLSGFNVAGHGLDSGITATGGHLDIRNGSLSAWSYDVPDNAAAQIGNSTATGVTYLFASFSGQFYCNISGGSDTVVPAPGTPGLYACERSSDISTDLYKDGSSLGTSSGTNFYDSGVSLRVGGRQDGYPVIGILSEASIGGALGAAGQAALSARMHTYMAAAGTGCPEADAYLVRAPGETAHSADLVALICGLVADGTWAKLDALYLLAQQTQADARLNLVSTSYPLVGTATFVPYKGFSAFTTPALDTGFNPGTAVGAHLQPSDGFIGAWSYAVPDWQTLQMGASTNTGGIAIAANYGGGSQYYCYIGYATPPFNTPPNLPGFYSCDKGDASDVVLYYNNAPSGPTQAQGTAAFPSANMYVGSAAFLAASVGIVSEVNFGAHVGAIGQAAFYARLRSYMTAVGAP
jgi:hypothetical protein